MYLHILCSNVIILYLARTYLSSVYLGDVFQEVFIRPFPRLLWYLLPVYFQISCITAMHFEALYCYFILS